MANFYDELFPGLDDDKDLKEAIGLIKRMNKEYKSLITDLKSASSEYQKNVNKIVKSTVKLKESLSKLDSTSEENRKRIAQISKETDIASASYERNNQKVKQLQGSVKVLVSEQQKFNEKSKEAIRLDAEKQRLTARLNSLTTKQGKEVAELRVQIQKKNAELKKEARESLGLVSIYQKQSEKMNELAKRYKDLVVAGKANTAEAKRMKRQHDELRATIIKADQSVGHFHKNVGRYTSAMNGLAVAGRQVLGALGFAGVVFGLVNVFKRAVNITKEYEQENAKLAGVLGVTRKETQLLQDDSKRLGATTRRTATQVVELQIAYARLGFTQSEILDVTKATIDGSIALNAELGDTATLVGALIRTFDDLDSADAAGIMDKLTISTQQSSNNFETLSVSLPKVAGAANAMGVSLEDVLSQLGVIQDTTQDASIAGTSLRNIYLALAKSGLTLDEALNKISNSQDQVTTAVELFDKRSAIAALALASQRDRTTELRKELDELGVVAGVVAEQNDTLAGSIDFAESAWQGLILSIEEGSGIIGGFLRGIIDQWTEFLTIITAANEGTINWGEALLAFQNPINAGMVMAKINLKQVVDEQRRSAQEAHNQRIATNLYNEAIEKGQDTFAKFQKANSSFFDDWENNSVVLLAIQEKYNEVLKEQLGIQDEMDTEGIIEALREEIKLRRERLELATSEDEIAALNQQIQARENELNRLSGLGISVADDLKRKSVEVEKAVINIPEELAGATVKSLSKIEEAQLKARIALRDTQQFLNQVFGEGLQLATDLFVGVNNLFFALEQKRIEQDQMRLDRLEEQRERELLIAGENAEARIAINKTFDQKTQDLERSIARRKEKQARAEKAAAIAQATIDTALAVSRTLGQTGFFGIPLSAIVASLGALQIATIAATPIPQFEKGTDNAPGGLAIVGEKGRELVIEPSGNAYLTGNKAELRDIPEGSQILTNAITERILNTGLIDRDMNRDASHKINEGVKAERYGMVVGAIRREMKKSNQEVSESFEKAITNLPEIHQWLMSDGDLKRNARKGFTTQRDVRKENSYGG